MDNDNNKKYKSKRKKPSSKVTNLEAVRQKAKAKSEQHNKKSNFYY